jgi:hypothetical protein
MDWRERKTMGGGELALDWGALVPRLVYPTKVLIIEAMDWIGQPLSATELEKIFGRRLSQSVLSYHLVSLAKAGALKLDSKQQVRGAWENRYYFTEQIRPECSS